MPKNKLSWVPLYPRAFMEGTIGLPLDLKGPYALILMMIAMADGRLRDDAGYISGLLGCSKRRWDVIRRGLIDAGKIAVADGIISNETMSEVLDAAHAKSRGPTATRRRPDIGPTSARRRPDAENAPDSNLNKDLFFNKPPEKEKESESDIDIYAPPLGAVLDFPLKGRLSPDWEPSGDLVLWTLDQSPDGGGVPDCDALRRIVAGFKSHYLSADDSDPRARRGDWAQAFKSWVIKQSQFEGKSYGNRSLGKGGRSASSGAGSSIGGGDDDLRAAILA